ncbi:hypothetical protein AMECASPLE_003164 [Ameca splendens]|uniref:Uncharacterized protein n=1 Tax=Ameca splendens TaxID=208324 RepID=A0ABV0XBK4_9TELE
MVKQEIGAKSNSLSHTNPHRYLKTNGRVYFKFCCNLLKVFTDIVTFLQEKRRHIGSSVSSSSRTVIGTRGGEISSSPPWVFLEFLGTPRVGLRQAVTFSCLYVATDGLHVLFQRCEVIKSDIKTRIKAT